jgi:hypothetical protein
MEQTFVNLYNEPESASNDPESFTQTMTAKGFLPSDFKIKQQKSSVLFTDNEKNKTKHNFKQSGEFAKSVLNKIYKPVKP